MVMGVSVNNINLLTRMADFYAITITYLGRSCGKRKNVTFFLLDAFLHPNVLHMKREQRKYLQKLTNNQP